MIVGAILYGRQPVDMTGHDVAAEFVAGAQGPLKIDAASRPCQVPIVVSNRVSGDASTSKVCNRRLADSVLSTTVRQTPEQAIEAPISIVLLSYRLAMRNRVPVARLSVHDIVRRSRYR